ncbi:hypothetical protein BD779DRAFT_1498926 [Infundibulicybe gibba]|nr:hypothetical protein BD779DRAFT_1498926 [Infundibulicybe gibba]
MSDDISLANTACRILIISSSVPQAATFINRLRNIGATPSVADVSLQPPGVSSTPIKIPWVISNKYYSAHVHFAVHTIHGLSPHDVRNAPAVIFVWGNGEPYRHNIERLSQDLSGYEPEVSLAVRIQSSLIKSTEDDGETDEYLSSHGFEFIEATEGAADIGEDNIDDDSGRHYSEGIPNIPRVLDALSTIMWPSMEARKQETPTTDRLRSRGILDWAQDSQDSSISAVADIVGNKNSSSKRLQSEMEELARWLEDEGPHEDPWTSAASGTISTSPTMVSPTSRGPANEETDVKEGQPLGFDDDFTVFISAPPDPGPELDVTPGLSSSSHKLVPPHASKLYRSLGSASDLGEYEDKPISMDMHAEQDNESDDDGLPTQDEIRATSSRIFEGHDNSTGIHPEVDSAGKDDYDMAPFDLSKVLGALQGMKAEIANMEDEGERRKAAARVALGLVYGLDASAENETKI